MSDQNGIRKDAIQASLSGTSLRDFQARDAVLRPHRFLTFRALCSRQRGFSKLNENGILTSRMSRGAITSSDSWGWTVSVWLRGLQRSEPDFFGNRERGLGVVLNLLPRRRGQKPSGINWWARKDAEDSSHRRAGGKEEEWRVKTLEYHYHSYLEVLNDNSFTGAKWD